MSELPEDRRRQVPVSDDAAGLGVPQVKTFTAGTIARSLAGRDAGRCYLVLRQEERLVWVTDGRHHPLASPKRKNIRHLRKVGMTELPIWSRDSGQNDAAIRRILTPHQKIAGRNSKSPL